MNIHKMNGEEVQKLDAQFAKTNIGKKINLFMQISSIIFLVIALVSLILGAIIEDYLYFIIGFISIGLELSVLFILKTIYLLMLMNFSESLKK